MKAIQLTNPDRFRGRHLFALAFLCALLPALCLAQAPPFTITTVIGTCTASSTVPPCLGGYAGDGGAAGSAQLNGPFGLAFDKNGNLFIADANNSRVREVANSNGTLGNISTVAGNGTQGFAGDAGTATSAELNSPSGVAFDSSGNLYIADAGNYEIREVVGSTISTFAGKNSLGATFSGDYGLAPSAALSTPTSVVLDSAGNAYIADPQNNVVRVVCANQTPIACGTLLYPAGGTYTWAKGDINTFAGQYSVGAGFQGDGGLSTGALLTNPEVVILDPAGNLLIADTGNNAIRKVTPAGIISTIAGNGNPSGSYSGDGGLATQAGLNAPKGIALDANGNLYIADSDNCVIRMVDPNGFIFTIAGIHSDCGYSGDKGPATSAQLYFPSGVAVYGGNVYVADNGNNVIRLLIPVPQVPQINAGGVVNDASYKAPVAPGSIASVFGDFFLTSASFSTSLPLSTSLDGLSFQFTGGTAAPLYFASSGQVNMQVPWELAGQSTASLTATLNGSTGAAQSVNVAAFAPAIFTVNSEGTGPGAILDSSYHLVSASNPAIAGTTYILIYCTGLGAVSANQPATGAAASTETAPTATLPTVTIGGVTENAYFSGLAPGFVGLYQVNVLVSAVVAPGSAVPVSITIGGATSNTVTIAVQ
jgi:uncharacterized protein (TIGR03437 family)